MKHNSRRIWLTGASSGIGHALAIELLQQGHKLALSARSKEPLQALARRFPEQVLVVSGDLTDAQQVRNIGSRILREWGALDTAILNAGNCEYVEVSHFEAAMVEAWSLGRACGVALADDFVAAQMRFADTLPHGMRSSMLNDLVAGRRLEAPWLCGAVERMAKPLRVATPINNAIHAALKPYCAGRPVAQTKEST